MKRTLLPLLIALLSVGLIGAATAQEQGPATSETNPDYPVRKADNGALYVPGELLVVNNNDRAKVIPVPEQTLKALKQRAEKEKSARPDAKIVEPNYVYTATATPNDPGYSDQYFFQQIGAPAAWNDTKGTGVRICVIDTGYDRTNPEFTNKVIAEKDFVQDDSTAQDANGHGTHVAGIAAVETNNGVRTAGVGWNSLLAIAKAGNANGYFTTADVRWAINWCQNVGGVSVINMSFADESGAAMSTAVETEIAESDMMGMILVAAAGNQGKNLVVYPAGYQYVIGVGATNPDGTLASFSNRGPHVDLVAPGVGIASYPDNRTESLMGTSQAAPQVAGGAALLYAKGLSKDQVRSRLFNQAEDRGPVGKDDSWGYGFLNLACATQPNLSYC